MLYQWTIQTIHNSSSLCFAQTEELPCHKPPHLELEIGKPYDRQPTGRAPLKVFSVVLLIISSRSCLWKRRFEQRSEEERDEDQRRKYKTPNSRTFDGGGRVVALEPLQGWRKRVTRIAHNERNVLVPKQSSRRRCRHTSHRHRPFLPAWRPPPSPHPMSMSGGSRRRRTGRWHPVKCAEGG